MISLEKQMLHYHDDRRVSTTEDECCPTPRCKDDSKKPPLSTVFVCSNESRPCLHMSLSDSWRDTLDSSFSVHDDDKQDIFSDDYLNYLHAEEDLMESIVFARTSCSQLPRRHSQPKYYKQTSLSSWSPGQHDRPRTGTEGDRGGQCRPASSLLRCTFDVPPKIPLNARRRSAGAASHIPSSPYEQIKTLRLEDLQDITTASTTTTTKMMEPAMRRSSEPPRRPQRRESLDLWTSVRSAPNDVVSPPSIPRRKASMEFIDISFRSDLDQDSLVEATNHPLTSAKCLQLPDE